MRERDDGGVVGLLNRCIVICHSRADGNLGVISSIFRISL
jgi:hypothetical protein